MRTAKELMDDLSLSTPEIQDVWMLARRDEKRSDETAARIIRRHGLTKAEAMSVVLEIRRLAREEDARNPSLVGVSWLIHEGLRLGGKLDGRLHSILLGVNDDEDESDSEREILAAGGPKPVGCVRDFGLVWRQTEIEPWLKEQVAKEKAAT